MKKLAVVVVFMAVAVVLSFSEYSFGEQEMFPANDVSDEIAMFEKQKHQRLAYIGELLKSTLADVEKLIKTKKNQKEQDSLEKMKIILEEDLLFLAESREFTEFEMTELEWHNDSINLIMDVIKRVPSVPNEREDSSVAKTVE